MTIYFMDTSAIAKRYIPLEIGAKWVKREVSKSSANKIIIAQLALAEMTSLLMRRQRENTLTPAQVQRIYRIFASHVRKDYVVVPLDHRRIKQARQLLKNHPLRTLDALQLASAIEFRMIKRTSVTFVSADTKLLNVANAEGFQIDNPLAHP